MRNDQIESAILKKLMPGLLVLALLIGCSDGSNIENDFLSIAPKNIEKGSIELKKAIALNNYEDQLHSIIGRLQSEIVSQRLYGIDIRSFRPFYIDLKTSSATFLVNRGSGPNELLRPIQLTVKSEKEIFVYDNGLVQIAHFENDNIIRKSVGYLKENLSERDVYGLYWNNHIFGAIHDPLPVNSLDFDNLKPIVKYNLNDASMETIGNYSPTADWLDHTYKWVHIALDKKREILYYVYHTDYTIMGLNLRTNESFVASTYRPEKFRVRTIPNQMRDTPVSRQEMIKKGLDRTHVQGIDILQDKLVVVWGNGLEKYYQGREFRTADNMEIFGLVYELPDFSSAYAITMNSKYIGSFDNYIMLEINDDIVEYTIGFYEFQKTNK